MENKIQQLTEKLYKEGLSKGKQESEQIIADAKQNASEIVAEAEKKAADILAQASLKGQELIKNSRAEVALASSQMASDLRLSLENIIIAKGLATDTKEAFKNGSFVAELIKTVLGSWDGKSVKITVNPSIEAEIKNYISSSVAKTVGSGADVELCSNPAVKAGFRVEPKNGGYYISFTDDSFNTLLGGYLRASVNELLFGGSK